MITAQNAARQDFMPLMRELVRAYQAFSAFDARLHRSHGLTASQADVVFTLGNTDGMTCGEIGDRTLITKGTLTGVIDRLADKGLVERRPVSSDGRCTRIVLTPSGQSLFESVFPAHIGELKVRFDRMSQVQQAAALQALKTLRRVFQE